MNESSTQKSIGFDALYQYAGVSVQVISGAVFYLALTRLFTTSQVGAIALFVAINGLFNIVFQLGLGRGAQHFISYYIGRHDLRSAKKVLLKIVSYGFIFSILSYIAIYLLSGDISLLLLKDERIHLAILRLLGIVVFGNVLFGVLNSSLLGLQKFKLSAIINIIVWTCYYLIAFVFAFIGGSLLYIILGWVVGILAGVAIEFASIIKIISSYAGGGNSTPSRVIFYYSIPVFLFSITSFGASYADRFIVAGFMALSQLGIYNIALLISSSINFIITPFGNILLPKFSELYGLGKKDAIRNNFRVASLLLSYVFVPAALGVISISGPLISTLAGVRYVGAMWPLDIIMFSAALFVVFNISIQALASIRKTRVLIFTSSSSFTINVSLSLLLIPSFGTIGAAVGYISVYVTNFFTLFYFAHKYEVSSIDFKGLTKIWISSLAMFFFLKGVTLLAPYPPYLIPIYILGGLIIYILLGSIMKIFVDQDKELVISLFPIRNSRIRSFLTLLLR
ncbi:hypothetical protein IX51_03955 [uncultured archaeon]|nr:hypothetical protein IX51_03955 [uncultured archaeon]